jgi:hypothetical protein
MGSNSSTAQLQERQPFPTVHCGNKVSFRDARYQTGINTRTCTLGWAVKRVRGKVPGQFNYGYLTLGGCVPTAPITTTRRGGHTYHVIYSTQDLVIGKTYNNQVNLKYDPPEGLDYAVIRITEPQV